jgi:hypothetical protein
MPHVRCQLQTVDERGSCNSPAEIGYDSRMRTRGGPGGRVCDRLVRRRCRLPCAGAAPAGAAHTALRLRLHPPIAFVQDPTDPTLQFVVQQGGRIRAVRGGTVLSPDFLDLTSSVLSGGERGLLGMALAPDYASSGRFYVNFTNTLGNTVIARFRRSSDPAVADPASRFDLRWGANQQPFIISRSRTTTAATSRSARTAICTSASATVAPATTRITWRRRPARCSARCCASTSTSPTHIPPATSSRPTTRSSPEAAAPRDLELRPTKPLALFVRPGTGALLIGDVGQNAWEEINYEPAGRGGRNYGWRNREGAHDHVTSRPPAFLPLTDPIHEYDHSLGSSITGGHVYRGSALGTAYVGRYFFADFIRSRVWSIGLTSGRTAKPPPRRGPSTRRSSAARRNWPTWHHSGWTPRRTLRRQLHARRGAEDRERRRPHAAGPIIR